VLQPAFWQELVCRREVHFLLTCEPRVAQNHSLKTTHHNHSNKIIMLLAN
jgi:hypothetical protein